MAVGVDISNLDTDSLPFHPPSYPPTTIDQDLLNVVAQEISTPRRRNRRFINRAISWNADTLGPLHPIDHVGERSPFRQLLRDHQAFSMWNQLVEMPEDQQIRMLSQLPISANAQVDGSNNVLRTPRRTIAEPAPNNTSNQHLSVASGGRPAVKISRRQRRRQRLDEDDVMFALEMDDCDDLPSPTTPSCSRISDRHRTSIPELMPDSPPTTFRGRTSSESFPTSLTPVLRVVTVQAKVVPHPPSAHKPKYAAEKGRNNSSEVIETVSMDTKVPSWLQRLDQTSLPQESWESLMLLEEHIRVLLEDPKKIIDCVDGTLIVDMKQGRVGLRLHQKDPLAVSLNTCIHSMANYYLLSFDTEWTGKGKKKFIEGWIYLPKGRKARSSVSSDSKKRKFLPDSWFVDVASRYLSQLR